ncbi:MAG: hypothetical protein ACTS6J_22370 [Burkholderiales bacterium]
MTNAAWDVAGQAFRSMISSFWQAQCVRQRTESPRKSEDHPLCDDESHPINLLQPHEETAMATITLKSASKENQQQWKTQEYRGKQIHVCTALRVHDNEALPGHGQQWDFKVRVTENGAGAAARECASAESDPESFYSTQAVTEDLGFTRGRELVEGM